MFYLAITLRALAVAVLTWATAWSLSKVLTFGDFNWLVVTGTGLLVSWCLWKLAMAMLTTDEPRRLVAEDYDIPY